MKLEYEQERILNEMKGKSIEELRAILSDCWVRIAIVIILNLEIRMRLHECQHHGHPGENGIRELLAEATKALRESFQSLERG